MIIHCSQLNRKNMKLVGPLVVGSGPVGLTLALLLLQRGVPVVVIEAGGQFPTLEDAGDLESEFTAYTLEGARVGRTRQIGGGLNLWGGQLASFARSEFQASSDSPGSWPFVLEEITQRFSRVAELLGEPNVGLPLNYVGLNAERDVLSDAGLELVATAWLKRPKLPAQIWRRLATSDLVTIVHGAFVDRIKLDDATGEVIGVSALRRDRSRLEIGATSVVLACGAIETSRLLLQPSPNGSAQPWHRLQWLGRGFNEHLDATTATMLPLDKRRLFDLFDPIVLNGTKYTFKLHASTGGDRNRLLSSVAMMTQPGNVRNSISELQMLLRSLSPRRLPENAENIVKASFASAREVLPLALRYLRYRRIGTTLRGAGLLRISVEQPIRYDSRVTLSPSIRDSRGIPKASIHWQKGVEEGLAFLDTTQRVKQWAEANCIAKVEIDPLLIRDPRSFAERADDGLHHAGGARIAKHPDRGVVDPNLAVFGVQRLYCCGTSVFPRIGFANPTLSAMALAVRLGERLADNAHPP
jgi:choline dehydrogenase-like flavoprotein